MNSQGLQRLPHLKLDKKIFIKTMASTSSILSLHFIRKLVVVKNFERPRPIFKVIPKIAKFDDSIRAFSKIPNGVAYAEDPRAYIHCNIEEIGSKEMFTMYSKDIFTTQGLVKPKHKILQDLGLIKILDMSVFEDEIMRYVLSRVHREFMWLDSIFKITKEAIEVVIGLPSTDTQPKKKKKIPNNDEINLIRATFDSHSLRVSTINDDNVKYASMVIGYKVAHTNRLNSVSR